MKKLNKAHNDVEIDILVNQHTASRRDIRLYGVRVLAYTVDDDNARRAHTALEATICNSTEFLANEQNHQTVLFETFTQTYLLANAFDLVEHNKDSVFGLKGESVKYFDIKSLNKVVVFGSVEFFQDQKKAIVLKRCLDEIMSLFDLGNAFIFHPVKLGAVNLSENDFERIEDYRADPDTFEGAGFVFNDLMVKSSMIYRPKEDRNLIGRSEKIGRTKSFSL